MCICYFTKQYWFKVTGWQRLPVPESLLNPISVLSSLAKFRFKSSRATKLLIYCLWSHRPSLKNSLKIARDHLTLWAVCCPALNTVEKWNTASHFCGIWFCNFFFFVLLICQQETSILDEYNINWTQKLGAGISGPVRWACWEEMLKIFTSNWYFLHWETNQIDGKNISKAALKDEHRISLCCLHGAIFCVCKVTAVQFVPRWYHYTMFVGKIYPL